MDPWNLVERKWDSQFSFFLPMRIFPSPPAQDAPMRIVEFLVELSTIGFTRYRAEMKVNPLAGFTKEDISK